MLVKNHQIPKPYQNPIKHVYLNDSALGVLTFLVNTTNHLPFESLKRPEYSGFLATLNK